MRSNCIADAIDQLVKTAKMLRDYSLEQKLRTVSEDDAAAMRGGILSIAGYLDDSISNPHLGSIFDLDGETPLNELRQCIADAYGVKATIVGTNGTTALNAAAVMALADEGEVVAVGRDAHVSIHGGIVLSGARPVYLMPPFNSELGVLLPLMPSDVAAVLDAHPTIRSAQLTLPTYWGLQGDIERIVRVCHERRVAVMIDEAHGPHYRFLHRLRFPMSAEEAGADIITQSTHKVLSALNQGSVIHFNNEGLLRRYAERQAQGFVSTSFSYLILVSVEHAINQICADGERMWSQAKDMALELRQGAARIPGMRVIDESVIDGERVTGIDVTRVTVNVKGTGLTGFQVADAIRAAGGISEMETPDTILFLVSPSVSAGQVEATIRAMHSIGMRAERCRPSRSFIPPSLPAQVLTPRQAMMLSDRERVPVDDAVGRISAETIGCYPPGQAIFVAGERISREGVEYLRHAVAAGAHLKRVRDDHFQTIEVIRDEDRLRDAGGARHV